VTFFPNRQVFQRYYEPATLIFLILWLALEAEGATPLRLGRTTWLLAILAVVQLSITFIFAYGRTFGAG
jgi:dolichyl-phosphate-mannose--protein O-mannosyl transferase